MAPDIREHDISRQTDPKKQHKQEAVEEVQCSSNVFHAPELMRGLMYES